MTVPVRSRNALFDQTAPDGSKRPRSGPETAAAGTSPRQYPVLRSGPGMAQLGLGIIATVVLVALRSQGGIYRVTGSAFAERRGAGLLALVSIGILIASLMLALRPAVSLAGVAECQRPLDVVLIIDRSGSMDLVTGGQSRLGWAKDAATQLVTGLDGAGGVGGTGLHQVGVTTYGNSNGSPPFGVLRDIQLGGSSAATVNAAINAYADGAGNGNTPLRQGMADGADNMLDGDRTEVDGVAVLQVLIFLSDGRPNPDSMPPPESDARPTPAEIVAFHAAADQSYGIAIGPNLQGEPLSEPDLALMNQIADPSGAPSGDDFVGGNYRHRRGRSQPPEPVRRHPGRAPVRRFACRQKGERAADDPSGPARHRGHVHV